MNIRYVMEVVEFQFLKGNWKKVLSLAGYDFWLLAFPLQGYFLLKTSESTFFPFFIVPHAITFFIIAIIGYKINFYKISRISGIITSILTALFPFLLPPFKTYAFIILGISSSLFIIRIGCILKNTPSPLLSSALGLIMGNILLALSFLYTIPQRYLFILLSLFLLIAVFTEPYKSIFEPLGNFTKYLPFIFAFYLLVGMFYVGLMPLYLANAYCKGIELAFYIFAILLSVKLFKIRKDFSLIAGVTSGIFAVAFFHYINTFTVNLSMYFVQMAAGFMDVFCFGLFLENKDIIRRFSLGAGCMLLGPAVAFPVFYIKEWIPVMVITGNIVLGVGLIIFYLLFSSFGSSDFRFEKQPESIFRKLNIPVDTLSPREKEVFSLIIKGKSIKDISSILNISESSVKTYLQRIYRKLNVSSKAELLKKVSKVS